MDPNQIMSIVGAYNADPRSFTDEEAEMVAMLASQTGMKFRRENKPFSKAMFNMADIGLLGMLPNEWEPYSRGQSVYGESFSEKLGSGAGAVAGLPLALLSGSALVRGGMGLAKGAWGMMKGARGMAGGGGAAGGAAAGGATAPYMGGGGNLLSAGRAGGNLLSSGQGGRGMLQLTGRPMRNLNPNSRKALRRNKINDEIMRRAEWNYDRSLLDTATIPAGYRSTPLTIGERLRMTESGFGDDVWDIWNPRNIVPY
jgi:hypothetical protein